LVNDRASWSHLFERNGRCKPAPEPPQPIRWCLGARALNFSRALREQFDGLHGYRVLPLDFDFEPEAMASEGFHPGPPIYALWRKNLAELIKSDFTREGDS